MGARSVLRREQALYERWVQLMDLSIRSLGHDLDAPVFIERTTIVDDHHAEWLLLRRDDAGETGSDAANWSEPDRWMLLILREKFARRDRAFLDRLAV